MRPSEQIQLNVLARLAYDPDVDSSAVAVTATQGGVVTLAGTALDALQAAAARLSAAGVSGVRAIVDELGVRDRFTQRPRDCAAIAEDALRALDASPSVRTDTVRVIVALGWLTLEGEVDRDEERIAAGEAVAGLPGVRGVANRVEVRSSARADQVRRAIGEAFRQAAHEDAEHVTVETSGDAVTLMGVLGSLAEVAAAERAALDTPGVLHVDNRLEVRAGSD